MQFLKFWKNKKKDMVHTSWQKWEFQSRTNMLEKYVSSLPNLHSTYTEFEPKRRIQTNLYNKVFSKELDFISCTTQACFWNGHESNSHPSLKNKSRKYNLIPLNLVDDTAVRSTFKTCNTVLQNYMSVKTQVKRFHFEDISR